MKTMMKLALALLLTSPWCAFAQKEPENLIKNGDFEKFTGENPDFWDTSNIPGTLTVVSPTKQSHSGAKAVKCEVKEFGGSIVAGYTCQKNIPTGGRELRISGSFFVRSVEKDQAVVILCFQNSSGSTVGTVEEYLEDTKSKFLDLSKVIKPPAAAASVHVRMTLLPSKGNEKAHVGSFMVCDDLKLTHLAPKETPLVQ